MWPQHASRALPRSRTVGGDHTIPVCTDLRDLPNLWKNRIGAVVARLPRQEVEIIGQGGPGGVVRPIAETVTGATWAISVPMNRPGSDPGLGDRNGKDLTMVSSRVDGRATERVYSGVRSVSRPSTSRRRRRVAQDTIFPTKTGRPRRFGAAVPLLRTLSFGEKSREAFGAAGRLGRGVIGTEATFGKGGTTRAIGRVRWA